MIDFAAEIQIADMPSDDMRLVAEVCGLDVAVRLMQGMGGMSVYVPKNSFALVVERYLRKQKSPDFKAVALAAGVSERSVRAIWRRLNGGELKQIDIFER